MEGELSKSTALHLRASPASGLVTQLDHVWWLLGAEPPRRLVPASLWLRKFDVRWLPEASRLIFAHHEGWLDLSARGSSEQLAPLSTGGGFGAIRRCLRKGSLVKDLRIYDLR